MQHLPKRLRIQRIPGLAVGLAWPPCSDIQIPCSLGIAKRRQPVRVSPEEESSEPCGQHVIMLQCRPHLGGRGDHVTTAAECMSMIPAGPVAQDAGNTTAALEL